MAILHSILGSWLIAVAQAAVAVSDSGVNAVVGDISYWIPPSAVGRMPREVVSHTFGSSTPEHTAFVALSLLNHGDGEYTSQSIDKDLERFSKSDDVWSESFSEVICLRIASNNTFKYEELVSTQKSKGRKVFLASPATTENLREGPYFVSSSGNIHKAYRLYSDHQESFVESTYENADGRHSVLPVRLAGLSLPIAVPSRLYYRRTKSKPLAGMRLAVKDIFDLAGVKTSNGNRAWYNLYPPVNTTATAVQRLIGAGAVVIGKQKTAQFANGEYSTSDWVDYHSPFNPRGDGYQDPNFSSAGGGAGVASYDWLDFALGSDTGGSIRGPAQFQGIYGLRPSHGLCPLNFTMPLAPELDTAALLVRDPSILREAARVLYRPLKEASKRFPNRIISEIRPTGLSAETNATLDRFFADLKNVLGADKIEQLNMSAEWQKTHSSLGPSMQELLNTTYITVIAQRQTELVRKRFYSDYAAKHEGRRPFVNPVPLARWAFGDSQPLSASADGIRNKTIWMNWFQDHILSSTEDTCSSAVLIYLNTPATQYRNAYRAPPAPPFGFVNRYWSVMAEAPDITIPIGQTPYLSTVTNHTEQLPVTLNLMVAKGCDAMLLDLVVELNRLGVLKVSKTGTSSVDGGDTLYKM